MAPRWCKAASVLWYQQEGAFRTHPDSALLSGRVQRRSVGPEGSCEESGCLGNKHDMCTQCHESGMCYITLQTC